MSARIIDGKRVAAGIKDDLSRRVRAVRDAGGTVRLDAVLVESGDTGARVYAENQGRTCGQLGIDYRLHKLDRSADRDDIAARIEQLNDDPDVHAIMLHMPVPERVDAYSLQRLIDPDKDVEGVNPANIGNIVYGRSSLAPCTALATIQMIRSTGVELRGRRMVVVGASNVVGKPIAVLAMRDEATVISCNKFTQGIEALARSADVLVVGCGVAELVGAEWVKPGAVVVDVGVNRVPGPNGKMRTVGDVKFSAVSEVAGWISPVPGGVGPVTVAMLLRTVVEVSERLVS
ncbi:MAG: bifunctional 5,10-methylenetetrahydrofolate dehydrogenase/5,10-methenyltetrahydrofolate cyclohydrolase [Planctomycetes bacterium]|nr:bifunctional 5,10-methylenetetrahydrofolate dehydrogenase/5,10-methenyltetrahydrofolate cyclohydrolase [Planctomycetota bacterium]